MLAPRGLGRALVDPAVATLAARGVTVRTGAALTAVETVDERVSRLQFSGHEAVTVAPDDRVILALPPTRLGAVLPMLDLPRDDAGILNAHFVVPEAVSLATLPPITGVVSAATHWVFVRGDVVSLTISAADRLGFMDAEPEIFHRQLWSETRAALRLPDIQPISWRMNKERRATFDQSPAQAAKRQAARTAIAGLFLAGDHTATGLPATIESAIRSGRTAAELAA